MLQYVLLINCRIDWNVFLSYSLVNDHAKYDQDRLLIRWQILHMGSQRLFSVKYLFGEAIIGYNFLLLEDG